MPIIKRALISVADKTGVLELAQRLQQLGVEILSTGGTAQLLAAHGVKVIEVASYTGFPEMMEGRLKTLHPRIHGGLLGRRGVDDAVMREHGIAPIDLVVVNLYPFAKTIARADCDLAMAIENIDIGGTTMLRAAAKNFAAVTVLVDTLDYTTVLADLDAHGEVRDALRFSLAAKAFEHCARYDDMIANYLGAIVATTEACSTFPLTHHPRFNKVQDLRYGENPHQQAAFYRDPEAPPGCVTTLEQLQGKTLSFNNIVDTDAALECVKALSERPACVIVKHANPCGAALGEDTLDAYRRAYRTDPTSAFGGIIAFNRKLDAATAQAILDHQFVEVIVAPEVDAAALAVLAAKPQVRVLACGAWESHAVGGLDYKRVTGGLLVQDKDLKSIGQDDLKVVTHRAPTEHEISDLLFAWKIAKFVKSNAIIYCKEGGTLGIGAGQMSRVDSARIAAMKATDAGLDLTGSALASDAFFPFRDGLDSAAAVGVSAVIQPGGSLRDREVIDAANEHNIAMVFTGVRHFRH